MFQVIIPEKARKDFDKIDARYRIRINLALISLGQSPFVGKKLWGEHAGEWSYRVGQYRIIYRIKKQELIVLIIKISHRQGAY